MNYGDTKVAKKTKITRKSLVNFANFVIFVVEQLLDDRQLRDDVDER